jgi:hypothetical protein
MDEILKEYLMAIDSVRKASNTMLDIVDAMIPVIESFDSMPVTESFNDLLDAMKRFAEQLVLMHMQRLIE